MYYLATPPPFFPDIAQNLGQAGLLDEKDGWRRLVVEKPFGSDLQSAKQLNRTLHKVLKEDQIFRIDHYLGKETVQNLLVFRFANTIFEPVWCRDFIDHVQISVAEEVGVGHRAGYYDKAGVVRDMFQNHIMQLLTLIAIDPPGTLKHEDLHVRKLEVLKALRPMTGPDVAKNTVRGQYQGYHDEQGVPPDSTTATFAAMRVYIDNDRWKGVPFFLRSGKNLAAKATEIIIQFKCPPNAVFPLPAGDDITPNILAICIQPDEGIFLRFEAKVPDTEADMRSVEMEFHYSSSFGTSAIPEAYERLILEIIQGDHTLFTQDDTTELAWKWIDPILETWEEQKLPPLQEYKPGTWGPPDADKLASLDGCIWMVTCGSKKPDQPPVD
jgi:glucose-6-phosphate 1-dehydrogenase